MSPEGDLVSLPDCFSILCDPVSPPPGAGNTGDQNPPTEDESEGEEVG